MPVVHFKRYRMEYDLRCPLWDTSMPAGYGLKPWSKELTELHARTKHQSFQDEVDANVFPCFSSYPSCLRLMQEIEARDGFLPEATWLVFDSLDPTNGCGTVQGLKADAHTGAIQNLGVVPRHRGKGIGQCLLAKALVGFREAGLASAFLDVTCDNFGAVRLYDRLGWKIQQVVYKSSEVHAFES